jgi:hypothetical protein
VEAVKPRGEYDMSDLDKDKFKKRLDEANRYILYHVWNPDPNIDAQLTAEKLVEKFPDVELSLKYTRKMLKDLRRGVKRIKRAKTPYGLNKFEMIAWSSYHRKPIPFDAMLHCLFSSK